jgi:sulfite reductase alpha subunit-like flavoprotein
MEEGVIEVFKKATETRGQNWDALFEKMKKEEKRWEVEVY